MDFPKELKYTKDHEWLSETKGGPSTVGVTAYAIEQLGDIVHVDLPQVGEIINAGSSFGTIESTKTVSDLYMPVDGKVVAINDRVLKNPESLQEDPYENGWLIKVEISKAGTDLMSADAYEKFVAEAH